MSLPSVFDTLRLPVIGAPLFIVSNPALVIAQCKAGVVGSFPALNARPQAQLDPGPAPVGREVGDVDPGRHERRPQVEQVAEQPGITRHAREEGSCDGIAAAYHTLWYGQAPPRPARAQTSSSDAIRRR